LKKAVLFDLGGTLVQYFEREEFPNILRKAIFNVKKYLEQHDLLIVSENDIWQRVMNENYESKNYRVRPLEKRLSRIFELNKVMDINSDEIIEVCRRFMQPIFSLGKCYNASKTVIQSLKSKNMKIAVVSNTTWGSPSILWREELKRKGLYELIDVDVFCRDVGWRKPARRIFEHTLKKLGLSPKDCVFVGDDPRWDIVGPKRIGMDAILIDRKEKQVNTINKKISVAIIRRLGDLKEKILALS